MLYCRCFCRSISFFDCLKIEEQMWLSTFHTKILCEVWMFYLPFSCSCLYIYYIALSPSARQMDAIMYNVFARLFLFVGFLNSELVIHSRACALLFSFKENCFILQHFLLLCSLLTSSFRSANYYHVCWSLIIIYSRKYTEEWIHLIFRLLSAHFLYWWCVPKVIAKPKTKQHITPNIKSINSLPIATQPTNGQGR